MFAHERLVLLGEMIHDAMFNWARQNRDNGGIAFPHLTGGCAVAAALLVKEAKHYGIHAEFVAAPNHAWVEYHGMIYDPTAIQFKRYNWYKVDFAGKDVEKCHTVLKSSIRKGSVYSGEETRRVSAVNKEWPFSQRPCNYELSPDKKMLHHLYDL